MKVRCPGPTYSGSTKEIEPPFVTAICDGCGRRVRLRGSRLSVHYLDVTIHEVSYGRPH